MDAAAGWHLHDSSACQGSGRHRKAAGPRLLYEEGRDHGNLRMLPLQEMESHGAGVPLRGTIRRVLAWAACCAIWILAALPALAQHEGHESKEASGAVPRELLERPLVLRQGIGKVHEVRSEERRGKECRSRWSPY